MDRNAGAENSALISLVGLALVVASAAFAIWWWSQGVWGDLSLINGILPYVTYTDQPPTDHSAPNPAGDAAPTQQGATVAPHCESGQQPEFSPAFSELKAQVGGAVGTPVGCPYVNPDNGDTLQQTSTASPSIARPTTH